MSATLEGSRADQSGAGTLFVNAATGTTAAALLADRQSDPDPLILDPFFKAPWPMKPAPDAEPVPDAVRPGAACLDRLQPFAYCAATRSADLDDHGWVRGADLVDKRRLWMTGSPSHFPQHPTTHSSQGANDLMWYHLVD